MAVQGEGRSTIVEFASASVDKGPWALAGIQALPTSWCVHPTSYNHHQARLLPL